MISELTPNDKYEGVVLAAGFSARMKDWKPEIRISNIPILLRTVSTMAEFCSSVVVVGGFNFDSLKRLIEENSGLKTSVGAGVKIVENAGYMKGMLSSVICGLKNTSENSRGYFIIPGDMPFVKASTYSDIIQCFGNKHDNEVVIPAAVIDGTGAQAEPRTKKGHPVLVSNSVRQGIITSDETGILRDVLKCYKQELCLVDDIGICFDIDNKEDLERAFAFSKNFNDPL